MQSDRRLGGVRGALVASLVALAAGAHAAAPSKPASPKIIIFDEAPPGPRDVGSASGLAGLMAGSPTRPIDQATLYVSGLTAQDRTLCVRLRRINGSYSALMVVDITGAVKGGAVTVPFGSRTGAHRFDNEMKGRPTAEIAVLAQVMRAAGQSCPLSSEIAPVSWSSGPSQPLTALVMSPNASAEVDMLDGRGGHACLPVTRVAKVSRQLTMFDTACRVPPLSCRGTFSTLRVRRTEGDSGGALPTIDAKIRATC